MNTYLEQTEFSRAGYAGGFEGKYLAPLAGSSPGFYKAWGLTLRQVIGWIGRGW